MARELDYAVAAAGSSATCDARRRGRELDYAVAAAGSSATCDAGRRVQTRLRSPYTLSTRPVVGQNLAARSQEAGKAAYSLEYGFFHASSIRSDGG